MTTNYASHFVSSKRDNGDTFVTLSPDRPGWLQDAVYAAHLDTLPNDWIYEECRAAVEAFDSGELDAEGDGVHDFADSRVDVYTKILYQWAADFCLTDTWAEAESEASDCGMPDETEKRIAVIQYMAIRRIAETMREACEGAKEESEVEA
jgi:hypothetical protein